MTHLRKLPVVLAAIAIVMMFFQVTVQAEANDEITDAQLVHIKQNCADVKASLTAIHANDALLRVKLGQLYEGIATDLMAPLNSRISLNRLDSTTLVAVTNEYQDHLKQFRTDYQSYEELLSATIRINCKTEPAKFYAKLQEAKSARKEVHDSTKQLVDDIRHYKRSFENFAKSYKDDTP